MVFERTSWGYDGATGVGEWLSQQVKPQAVELEVGYPTNLYEMRRGCTMEHIMYMCIYACASYMAPHYGYRTTITQVNKS